MEADEFVRCVAGLRDTPAGEALVACQPAGMLRTVASAARDVVPALTGPGLFAAAIAERYAAGSIKDTDADAADQLQHLIAIARRVRAGGSILEPIETS